LIFSAAADILSELTMISDEKSREEMIAKLPKQLQAATCIGCGLELAVQVIIYSLLSISSNSLSTEMNILVIFL
jgi:hypothetical protein